MPAWLSRPTALWSSKLLDAVVLAYAAFTLCSHAVVLSGGTPAALGALAAAVLGGGAVLAVALAVRRRRRRGLGAAAGVPSEALDPDAPGDEPVPDARRLALAALAVPLLALWLVLRDPMVQWIAVTLYLGLCYAESLRGAPAVPSEPRRAPLHAELLVAALAVLCAFLALYAHRFRNDDCYYVNLAVGVADAPDAPLLAEHSIHEPLPDVPRSNAVFWPYRVHSWEALGGVLARALDTEPIRVMHLGMAAIAAALVPLAFARLFRLLDPRRWAFMLLAAIGLYLFEGSSGLGFANQGVVRAFTGKSVLLSVVVPLLVHHAIALAARPSARGVLRLLVTHVAAIGLSSTALWLAPMATMLGVAVPLAPRLRSLRPLALGLLACGYTVGLGLVVRAQMMTKSGAAAEAGAAAAVAVRKGGLKARWDIVGKAFEQMFEAESVTVAFVTVLLLAIPLARTALARRYLALFCFTLAVLLVNPFVMNFLRHNVTGSYTSQRVMWLAPVPAATAALFAALIPALAPAATLRARRALAAGALALFLLVVPTKHVFSRDNDVTLRWPPRPKVPANAFEVVRRLTAQLTPQSVVLAPNVVSWFLPTVRSHPFPLLANPKYLAAPRSEDRRRQALVELVSTHRPTWADDDLRTLTEGVARYRIDAVVLNHGAAKSGEPQRALLSLGFRRVKAAKGFQLWLAPSARLRERS